MYAAKRKLHNFLESITGPSNGTETETQPIPPENEDILERAKRRRLDITRRIGSSSNSALTAKSNISKLSRPVTAVEHRPTPSFAPWDRNQFLGRLKTFRHVDKWTAKPRSIDEVQWAKRGWSCHGVERVKCAGSCGKELVVKIAEQDLGKEEGEEDVEDALVKRYEALIIDGHDVNCLWRRRGCDDNIYHLPLATQSVCIPALRDRYKSLFSFENDIPMNLTTPNVNPEEFEKVEKYFAKTYPETTEFHKSAFKMALFGWEAENGHVKGLVSCQACFRRLGLWLFKEQKTDSEDSPALVERLDVILEHREYCPWVNASSQSGLRPSSKGGKLAPGWEILIQTLRGASQSLALARSATNNSLDKDSLGKLSDVRSADSRPLSKDDPAERASKDEDRWSRLRKMKRMFDSKSSKKP